MYIALVHRHVPLSIIGIYGVYEYEYIMTRTRAFFGMYTL